MAYFKAFGIGVEVMSKFIKFVMINKEGFKAATS
jgi:hypothetical protein